VTIVGDANPMTVRTEILVTDGTDNLDEAIVNV
jgi:hypothetical protein